MWEKLQNIDRRWIYLIMAIAIIVPLMKPMGLPIKTGEEAKTVYNEIAKLQAGQVLWLAGDYAPSSSPELDPMCVAVLHQAFRQNLKVVIYCMWEDGAMLVQGITEKVAAIHNKQYGVDWVNIGWKAQAVTVLRNMTDGIANAALTDIKGTPLTEIPLMKTVKKLDKDNVAFIFDLTTGNPGAADYLARVSEPKGVPMSVGCTAVSATGFTPYVRSGQYRGMLNGMRGAAEMEILVKVPGAAIKGMDAQSLGHFVILFFIIVGNLGYLLTRKKA
jgi:hypothetical protein